MFLLSKNKPNLLPPIQPYQLYLQSSSNHFVFYVKARAKKKQPNFLQLCLSWVDLFKNKLLAYTLFSARRQIPISCLTKNTFLSTDKQ